MSAGLKFLGNQEPGSAARYPDHYYIYTGGIDAFDYSITRPQEYPPNTDGRYRNSDPLTITYLAKLAVTKRGENFLTWPQRALFDRIGIRRQVLETDPYGNFLITDTTTAPRATGRGSACCISRTACGRASASCPRAGRRSWAPRRRRGSGPNTARSSG